MKIKTLFLQVENRIGKMEKTYQHNEKESVPSVAESLAPYGTSRHPHVQGDDSSGKEKIIKDTMSVDDYFDELISLVHEDYANLRGENWSWSTSRYERVESLPERNFI